MARQIKDDGILKLDKLERADTIQGEAFDLETEKIRINDPGIGKEQILRHFLFKAQPVPKGYHKPSKLEIISYYKQMIELSLWSDGLIIREDKPIELHTRASCRKVSPALYQKMVSEGADFVILVLAEPRRNQSVLDKPHRAI